ncbi:MAG: hypothetical protein ACM31I_00605 [Deltaproteobacteria bacterium]
MRRREMIALAVVGIFLVAPVAISTAGDWHWGSSSGTYGPAESHSSMGSADPEASLGSGDFETREPVEAGKLPTGERGMSSDAGSASGEEIQTVEAGGLWFRQGIDTGP